MKKKTVVIALAVCIFGIVVALIGYKMIQQKQQIRELLELGSQYLEEERYEEAIVTYKQLLVIEPKNETARENIVVAAIEWSDDLIEVHEYDKAEEVITDVYSIVPDKRLEDKRKEITKKREAYDKELLEIRKKEEQRQQAQNQLKLALSQLAKICFGDDEDAIINYLKSDDYQNIIESEFLEFDKKYETEYGSLGLYDNGKYLYFGDYVGEIRAGRGAWYSAAAISESPYVARGEWLDDMPNGNQSIHFTVHHVEGNVINGYWDGEIKITISSAEGANNTPGSTTFYSNYHMGIADELGTTEDGVAVHGYGKNKEVLHRQNNNLSGGIMGFCEAPM